MMNLVGPSVHPASLDTNEMADVLFFCALLIARSSPPQNTATWGTSCPRAAWKTSSRRVRCARRNVRWRSGYRARACPSVSFARVACIHENGRVSRREETPPSKTPSRKTSAPSSKDSWRRKSSRCKSRSSVKDQRTTSCRGQSERSGVIQAGIMTLYVSVQDSPSAADGTGVCKNL